MLKRTEIRLPHRGVSRGLWRNTTRSTTCSTFLILSEHLNFGVCIEVLLG